jgi:hypothetical protein
MAASEALKIVATLNQELRAAIAKAAKGGLDQALIAEVVSKAAELVSECDDP